MKGGGDYELYADNPIPQDRAKPIPQDRAKPNGFSIVVIVMDERADLDVQRENLVAFWAKTVGDARVKGEKLEWNEIKLQYPPNVYHR